MSDSMEKENAWLRAENERLQREHAQLMSFIDRLLPRPRRRLRRAERRREVLPSEVELIAELEQQLMG